MDKIKFKGTFFANRTFRNAEFSFYNIPLYALPGWISLISTVGPRSGPKVEFRQHISTHVLRALKRTTFCQGMQLKEYGHFGTGTSFQNPCSYQNV